MMTFRKRVFSLFAGSTEKKGGEGFDAAPFLRFRRVLCKFTGKEQKPMAMESANINIGHCQGIIVGEVYSPKKGIALVTLKVKDKKRKEDGKGPLHFIQFVAYDDLAKELLDKGSEGRIVCVRYHLSTNNRKDENGVSRFFDNRIIDKVIYGQVLGEEKVSVPYINAGMLQGEFAGLKRLYDGRNLWSLMIRENVLHESGRMLKRFHRFIIDRDDLKFIAGRRKSGDPILVEYRVASRKEETDGGTEHFTEYILTSLV